MSAERVLAIDVGTSGVRCLITDLQGRLVALSHQEWAYEALQSIAPLGKEFDPDVLWRIICDNTRRAIKDAGSAKSIVGVSATSQREGAVFLDKEGNELYAGPNIDLRAVAEGMALDSESGKEIYSITGHTPSLMFVPARLKWFERNQPQTYRRIATVLAISDWVIFKLCGERVSEVCSACEVGLVDIRSRTWSDRLRDLLGLPAAIYPALGTAGSKVGKVTRQAAADTGIPEDTPVSLGAPDTHCGLIGMGIKEKGQAGVVVGWSAPVQMVVDEPVLDHHARIWTGCHVLPRRWLLESSAGEAGNAYRWLKETLFSQDGSSKEAVYDLMDRLAQQAPPGADGVLAFVGPGAMDMTRLTLKLGGFIFPVPLSVTGIHRGHLVRAALENLCFAIKANCLQLETISGIKVREIGVGGGLARSGCFVQTLPAVLDMPVTVADMPEVSALGAAMCAAAGSGVYGDLEEAMRAMKPRSRVMEPDCLAALEYAEHYQRWTAAAKGLDRLNEEIN